MKQERRGRYLMTITKGNPWLPDKGTFNTNRRWNKVVNLGSAAGRQTKRPTVAVKLHLPKDLAELQAKVVSASVGERVTQVGYVKSVRHKGTEAYLMVISYTADSGNSYKAYLTTGPHDIVMGWSGVNAIQRVDTKKWIPVVEEKGA